MYMVRSLTKIFVRTEGNSSIGMGHVMRSKAFASMVGDNYEVTLIFQNTPDSIIDKVSKEGYTTISTVDNETFLKSLTGNEIVVLDMYHHDEILQKEIKNRRSKLVCINDTPEGIYYCDLIINHAPGVSKEHYTIANENTKFALGPDYSLLRFSFLDKARKQIKNRKKDSVFICFGGSDPLNLTKKVLSQLIKIRFSKKIVVVTGPGYQDLDSLKVFLQQENIFHYHDISENDMLALLETCYYAIVPASTILYEALAVGCTPITTYYIENQKMIFDGFSQLGSIIPFKKIEDLKDSVFQRDVPNKKQIVDGKSAVRIEEILQTL
jgi:UDP-2,4-diacetamido-2,4,6-trideoxy-beta-L-altropyranose hydrolase